LAISAVSSRTVASSCSGSAASSAIVAPAKVTASASGRSRCPWQTGQSIVST
jgi:hypothetical protein